MRKVMIGFIGCIFALAVSFVVSFAEEEELDRYHQHLEETEKVACDHGPSIFCTHLPLIQINTNGYEIPGLPLRDETGFRYGYTTTYNDEETLPCQIKVTDHESENNHISDTPSMESRARIRIRGNSSRTFDKYNYRIVLKDEQDQNNPQEMMGMSAHHEWALHGPILDRTLIRNYLCYNLAGELMEYAPNVRFCELIINGQYMGLYLMTETVAAGKNGTRLNISVDKKDNSYSGYILRLDRGSQTDMKNIKTFSVYAKRTALGKINISYPGNSNLTPELAESMRQNFSDFEHMLYTFDFDNSEYGYSKSVDVDNFVTYLLINEFTCNLDAGTYSTYIYIGTDGKYRTCVWDFNNAFDNYQETAADAESIRLHDCLWFNMMVKDEDFTEAIVKRYFELRETFFSDEYLHNYIDETIEYLGPAIERNYEKWGYIFQSDHNQLYPIERNVRSYDAAVKQLKEFITRRGAWLDKNIDTVYQYSADSKTKLFKEHSR